MKANKKERYSSFKTFIRIDYTFKVKMKVPSSSDKTKRPPFNLTLRK